MAEIIKENVSGPVDIPAKIPSTPEGMAIAYASLVVMALLPIFFGSFRSAKHVYKQLLEQEQGEEQGLKLKSSLQIKQEQGKNKEQKDPGMSQKDAVLFPLFASCALLGLYIIFQLFTKEYINQLLSSYIFCLGITALCHLISPVMVKLVPASIPNIPYHLRFTQGRGENLEEIINYRFCSHDLVCMFFCSLVGVWYILEKHWIANNLLGLAFAVNGVELLHLKNVTTGFILLCGLFLYDIFWVFGTNVMVTVAKSFEAPIKLVFPHDIIEKGFQANNFAMLGLGDIVIPGIFIALLLRFDNSLKRNSKFYFYATFIAYVVGLVATICIMHVYKHAQPALLYLVPLCLGTPVVLAFIRGDLTALLKYEDSTKNKCIADEIKKDKKKKK